MFASIADRSKFDVYSSGNVHLLSTLCYAKGLGAVTTVTSIFVWFACLAERPLTVRLWDPIRKTGIAIGTTASYVTL